MKTDSEKKGKKT